MRRRIGVPGGSRTRVLADTLAGLTAVFGMGTGVAPPLWPPRMPTRGVEPRYAVVGIEETTCTCDPVTAWTRIHGRNSSHAER